MLALQQAQEVRASILEYLKATFSFKEQAVNEAFLSFLEDEQQGLFKGPYISLKLPFEQNTEGASVPLEIKPPFPPFNHQRAAFERLSTEEGRNPQPTLLTTGTGSGKTESFLYPILDYCYKQRDRKGIKCIVLYPMNALATDQANRLAAAIHEDQRLKGSITAGLFIGLGKDSRKYPSDMTAGHIIENRTAILDSPPDILLTNFKMLDYALMRHDFHDLWRHNQEDSSLLKFLVLDELHTYDGAQGTDVANLIRRLKLKLDLPKGQICPVGTSATIGSGEEAPKLLAEYASKLFGEEVEESAIITEKRVSAEAFFKGSKEDKLNRFPSNYKLQSSKLIAGDGFQKYVEQQLDLWQIDPNLQPWELGEELKKMQLVWDITELCSQQPLTVKELVQKLDGLNVEFKKIPEWDAAYKFNPKESIVHSLLSLIAIAKTKVHLKKGEIQLPLLYLQVQLWVRELSGLLRVVSSSPKFTWRDKQAIQEEPQALPAYFCRECGASGWLAVKHDNRNKFESEISDLYSKYFSNHKNVFFLNTLDDSHQPLEEYSPTEELQTFVNQYSLHLHDKEGSGRLPVIALRKVKNNKAQHFCPECNTQNTVSIIGTRVSTLASVTTSQVLATDLDQQNEKDRKLLAFTNGVQDAAHQAGFIEARNYRFALRTALQTVINLAESPVSLPSLQNKFIEYWKEKADESGKHELEAYLYRFFPSDRAGEVKIPAYREKDGQYKDLFVREFDTRVSWEIASEFGYNATIGRTLEKTGASGVHFDTEKIAKAFHLLKPWMEANQLAFIQEEDFVKFLHGVLYRMRVRGGIDHPYLTKFRSRDLKLWDLNWMNDGRHFMNRRFGPRSRLPKLLTNQPENRGVLDSTYSKQTNWFHAYFTKSFPLAPYKEVINDFFSELLQVLSLPETSILNVIDKGKASSYCIEPSAIYVSKHAATLQCSDCMHQLPTSEMGMSAMKHAKCIQYRCTGSYVETDTTPTDNYYQQVYNRQRAPRIYATDHTGLLERKDRENKERDFKERPKFNSLNTIVATSTLEMGIDIGNLNVTMNNSVPPMPANFLQRIGRAGRKSGSALVVNFALNKPHDLYYFEEPKDMMDGAIATPGCYLDARDILRRHFFAFCIDSWTQADPQRNIIPRMVRNLKPATANFEDPQFFIHKINTFVKSDEKLLLQKFQSAYAQEVESEVFEYLQELMISEQFYQLPLRAFRSLKEEYQMLREKRAEIKKYINEKKLDKKDQERSELEQEGRNLYGMMKAIEKRQVLEYMTNIGLLPNYAFPETGVTLNARVRGKVSEGSDALALAKDIEVVRPASQAIKELVPDNLFYTQGYKLKVTGLNVLNWKEESKTFQYCSQCDHIEKYISGEETVCPKCGSDSFASIANRHQFLKLQGVRSFNFESDAKLDDGSEERRSEFAIRSRHFRFAPQSSHGAYAIRKIPFGIEYVREVNLLDVNAGLSSDFVDRNRTTLINEREVPITGFITCKSCGKSSSQTYKNTSGRGWEPKEARDFHFPFCRDKNKVYEGKPDETFEELFLYREMKTEAIKVLLPVQEFESESAISMFKAGLELGLRKYYQGNPQHLVINHYSEYNFQTLKMDRYLVLFDIIPGGTGYLEKLFAPSNFQQVLKLAYASIRDCVCQHQGKDGCYRCIYSYANQFEQEELSRNKAEQLFRKIIEASMEMEYLPHGLGKVTNTGQIEESELEDLFIRALRKYANDKGGRFEELNRDGIICYTLYLENADRKLSYFIQPQYRLGPNRGVKYVTIADFLIRCEGGTIDGKALDPEQLEGMPSIAIFLDGFQYHASQEHPRFPLDIEKRIAVQESGQYLSWTLTWDDVKAFEEDTADTLGKIIIQNDSTKKVLKKHPVLRQLDTTFFRVKNNFSRLLWLLDNSIATGTESAPVFSGYLLALEEEFGRIKLDPDKLKDHLLTNMPLSQYNSPPDEKGNTYLHAPVPTTSKQFDFRLFYRLRDLKMAGDIRIQDYKQGFDKEDWNTFWLVFNLLHPSRLDIKISEHRNEESSDPYTGDIKQPPLQGNEEEPLEEILCYYDEEYHELIKLLYDQNVDFSKDGSFFLESDGEIVAAEAVLGFKEAKVVLGPLSEEDEEQFKNAGYKVLTPGSFRLDLIQS